MADINPSGYEFRRRAYPNDKQNDTFRLADVILFSLGDLSSSNEKVVKAIYRDVTFVCKGRDDIHITPVQAVKYQYEYIPQRIVSWPSTSPISRPSKVKTNCYQLKMYVNKDYNGDDFLMMERRKEFMGKVFAKWGINVDKLSDAIERFYTCPIDNFDDVESFDNQRKSFSTEIQNCIEYYDKYGADALFVSSHRWTLQNAIIPLMVEQDFYDNLRDKEVYDNLPFAKRKNLLLKHKLDETMSIAHKKLQKNEERASQNYLTITTGQMLMYGKQIPLSYGTVKKADFERKLETLGYAIQLPQHTRVVDSNGNILEDTGDYPRNMVYSSKEHRFIVPNELEASHSELSRSFRNFLSAKSLFEMFFTDDELKSLWKYAENTCKADGNPNEEGTNINEFLKDVRQLVDFSFHGVNTIMKGKNGVYRFPDAIRQGLVKKLVTTAASYQNPQDNVVARQQQKGEEDAKKDPKVLKIE